MAVAQCALDTNILLRGRRLRQADELVSAALEKLAEEGTQLCYTAQNIAEFWNVRTRPVERNGFGFSVAQTDEHVKAIEETFHFLPAGPEAYQEWRRLVSRHAVKGVQVHDAKLAAVLSVNRVYRLLTFSVRDCDQYHFLQVQQPQDLLVR